MWRRAGPPRSGDSNPRLTRPPPLRCFMRVLYQIIGMKTFPIPPTECVKSCFAKYKVWTIFKSPWAQRRSHLFSAQRRPLGYEDNGGIIGRKTRAILSRSDWRWQKKVKREESQMVFSGIGGSLRFRNNPHISFRPMVRRYSRYSRYGHVTNKERKNILVRAD